MGRRTTTVFVIDDHPVVREGIQMLLDASGEVTVVGGTASASAALEPLAQTPPDVLLLDLDLGAEDGLVWLPRIRAAAPGTSVLILTALRGAGRDEAAFHAGARGFVAKDASPEVLLRAIRRVSAGELWFEPRVLSSAARASRPRALHRPSKLELLTAREREIVALIGEGLRNEEVARRLGINEKTVRNHLTLVFGKLGVSGRLELLVYAYQHGAAGQRR